MTTKFGNNLSFKIQNRNALGQLQNNESSKVEDVWLNLIL